MLNVKKVNLLLNLTNFWHFISFNWVYLLVQIGVKRHLQEEDLLSLPNNLRYRNVLIEFQRIFKLIALKTFLQFIFVPVISKMADFFFAVRSLVAESASALSKCENKKFIYLMLKNYNVLKVQKKNTMSSKLKTQCPKILIFTLKIEFICVNKVE
ncbi:hypothetical protein ABK040_007424 [Willaertia magna]